MTLSDVADLCKRLRSTRATMLGTEDGQHYADCHEAAAMLEAQAEWIKKLDGALTAKVRRRDLTPEAETLRAEVATLNERVEALEGLWPENAELHNENIALRAALEEIKDRGWSDDYNPCDTARAVLKGDRT